MNDPRGSIWRKWDLHVHTPDSLVNSYEGADPWGRFINELEQLPPEFKVIGINDYIFLDGYKKVLAAKKSGRLANIDLFLPVIELRIDKFGGSPNHLSRVNYHIIFSDQLSPDIIEQQFLNTLSRGYILSSPYDYLRQKWTAIPTKQSLVDLGNLIIGSVPPEEKGRFSSPLIEGFSNLCFSLDNIHEALKSHYFDQKYITAVGKTEWADIKWNDHTIAEKKTIINGADLVFISVEDAGAWMKAKKSLRDGAVNHLLLDCSDAHRFKDAAYKDKIGKCFTWIKADPTFEGLRQVLNEPDDRVFIGDVPPKLTHVQSNKTKYIKSIRMERKAEATITETWFDNTVLFNSDLIAIIGNKGKGKSALTDTIGLLCNTKQHADLTFLSDKNFRQPKDNKARHFQATLTWESGVANTKGLEDSVELQQPELAKYIPQNFLEKICTQLGRIEESDFDRELKKVIFSHVDAAQRLGKASLDELINFKTSEATARIRILKQELHSLCEELVYLELCSTSDYREKIENAYKVKKQELEVHEKFVHPTVAKPENDPTKQKEIAELSTVIETAKKDVIALDAKIFEAKQKQAQLALNIATIDRLLTRLENFERQTQTFDSESKEDLASVGIKAEEILKVSINKAPLADKRRDFSGQKSTLDGLLNPAVEGSLIHAKVKVEGRIEELQSKLDEPNKKYQAYQTTLAEWEKKKRLIIGTDEVVESIKFYEKLLHDLDAVPQRLSESRIKCLNKGKEIYGVIRQLADTYRELYAPVNQFIETRSLVKDKFQLNFEVGIIDNGFEEDFFEIITHGVAGTFCGIEDGHKMLREILFRHDFNSEVGVEAFLTEMIDCLLNDKRPGGGTVKVIDQIRKGKTSLSLHEMIFSLEYLKPRYSLRMGNKELHQLSPGERGTLLLVFYLLVDKEDIPLIIDQPEENLDNQTVYELLVPCMKEAKKRRQIFIVTHNPNLAVVCDAEQVIFADLDKKNNYRMRYLSGAIENPEINKAIVDVLEGTMPAFNNRDSKYLEG